MSEHSVPHEAVTAAAAAMVTYGDEVRQAENVLEAFAQAILEAALPHFPALHLTMEEIDDLVAAIPHNHRGLCVFGCSLCTALAKLRAELERREER